MLKLLAAIAFAAGIGWIGASLEAKWATEGFEERLSDTRETFAERKGQVSHEEVIKYSIGTPKVEVVGGADFDFGTMKHGETLSHEFLLRNIGDGPLNLEMGSSTCKCTVGDLEKATLAPGEETKVKLTWTANTIIRTFGQSAKIITTDPSATEVSLNVRGLVVHSFVSEPTELTLGDIVATEGLERKFHIIDYLDGETELRNLAWAEDKSREFVELSYEKVDVDTDKFPEHSNSLGMFEVTLKLKPGMPLGPLNTRVQFETDQGEKIGVIDIPVSGKVTGDVTLMGGSSLEADINRVTLGSVSSKQGASVTIFLRVRGDQAVSPPTIARVTPSESLNASIGEPKPRDGSTLYPIRIEIPQGAAECSLTGPRAGMYGQVVLKTGGEFGSELPIYVRMVVTK